MFDTSGISKKMSSATKGINHKIKIGAKVDLRSVNKQLDSISKKSIKAPKIKAPKIPTPKMPRMKTIGGTES
ncbi:tape measure protein [Lactobacillus phage S16]|nr:tape measure protein [Lactobacillus phage S16]